MSRSVRRFPPLCLPADPGIGRVPCLHIAEPIPYYRNHPTMRTSSEGRAIMRRSGLTLLELIVVLAILVALAAVTVPLLGNRVSSSQIDTTYQTMLAIREAIMGQPGYFPDTKGLSGGPYFTRSNSTTATAIADAAGMPATLNDLFVNPGFAMANGSSYDPLSRKGWRGPYLNQTMGSLGTDSSGNVVIRDAFPPPTGQTASNPILLEWPTAATAGSIPQSQWYQYVRLRSYGANGQASTGGIATTWVPSTITPTMYGDDLILYIRRDIPGIDWTNYYNLKQGLGN